MLRLVNLTNLKAHTYNRAMGRQVNLYEAKTQLSRLVEEASKGTEIIIAKNDKPMARLVALARPRRSKRRKLGISGHRFIESTPRAIADAEIAEEFENGKLWPDT